MNTHSEFWLGDSTDKIASMAATLNAVSNVAGKLPGSGMQSIVASPAQALNSALNGQKYQPSNQESPVPKSQKQLSSSEVPKKVDDKQAQKVLEAAPTQLPDVKPTPKASPLKTDVAAYIKEQPELIRAVIQVESSGNPRAVSPTGPQGLMQLTKQMQRRFGVTDPFNHEQNVKAGTELLNMELKKWKDPRIALAAYNQGDPVISRAVRKAKELGKEPTWENIKEFIPVEGRNYPLKVAKAYQKLKLTDV